MPILSFWFSFLILSLCSLWAIVAYWKWNTYTIQNIVKSKNDEYSIGYNTRMKELQELTNDYTSRFIVYNTIIKDAIIPIFHNDSKSLLSIYEVLLSQKITFEQLEKSGFPDEFIAGYKVHFHALQFEKELKNAPNYNIEYNNEQTI